MTRDSQATEHAARTQPLPLAANSWEPGSPPDPLAYRRGPLGAPVPRVDGPLKVAGAARFAAEVPMKGMVYAGFTYSTVPKGRIVTIDTDGAEASPGVVLVMTHRNAPPMGPPPAFATLELAASGDDLPVMQDDRVHWNGQPIAVVLAETQEQADHAASLISATYAPEPATTSFEAAKEAGLERAAYWGVPLTNEIADADAALAAAPVAIDEVYTTPRHSQNAMEPHAATVAWDGDLLVVHDCTQMVTHTAWSLAQVFGVAAEQVRVTAPFVGGGFGGKTLWQQQILGAAAAKLADRPVRVALSREGVYRIVGGRTRTEQRVAIGASADGRFDAIIHTGVFAMTEHNAVPEPFISNTRVLYSAGSFRLGVDRVNMDMVANSYMRGPGESTSSFALESAVDELAERLRMDPLELRIRNEPERNPTSGRPFSSRHAIEAYRAGAERFGWAERNATPRARREGEWLVGMGVAAAAYPYVRFGGGAARLVLHQDGRATVEAAAHEMGMGTATMLAQVTAARLGLSVEQVTVTYGDSSLPGVVMAAGAQQTVSLGAAVVAAQHLLVGELLAMAGDDSPLAGLTAQDVGVRDGGLCRLDDPDRWEGYAALLARAQRQEVSAEGVAPPPSEMAHWSMHSFGAMFCEARVNAVTGETRVSRFLGSFDCGRILNARTAASQFRGGIVMGLGMALMEETQFDERNGRIMNPSLAEYLVPVHMDVPEIDVIWTDVPDPHAPMGAHGVGEIGIVGVAAAVANAVYNATGRRVRDLPITLDKLL